MTTRGSVAKSVSNNKAKHPELYCPEPRCLWRTGGGRCPRHRLAESKSIAHEPLNRWSGLSQRDLDESDGAE